MVLVKCPSRHVVEHTVTTNYVKNKHKVDLNLNLLCEYEYMILYVIGRPVKLHV